MQFQETVRRRRMVRSFQAKAVPAEVLERILDNARRGPSAGFTQGFDLLVLDAPEQTTRFWEAVSPDRAFARAGWPGVYRAPVLVVPLAHKQAYLDRYAEPDKGWSDRDEARWPVPYWYVDTSFAALLILLTAVDAGLAALLFGIRDPAALRAAFGVPAEYEPIGAIAIGYAAPDRPSRSLQRGRRAPEAMIHRGRW